MPFLSGGSVAIWPCVPYPCAIRIGCCQAGSPACTSNTAPFAGTDGSRCCSRWTGTECSTDCSLTLPRQQALHSLLPARRDGGVEAVIDHDGGFMASREVADVYATEEPQAAFHARVAFCLDIHNEVRRGAPAQERAGYAADA